MRQETADKHVSAFDGIDVYDCCAYGTEAVSTAAQKTRADFQNLKYTENLKSIGT